MLRLGLLSIVILSMACGSGDRTTASGEKRPTVPEQNGTPGAKRVCDRIHFPTYRSLPGTVAGHFQLGEGEARRTVLVYSDQYGIAFGYSDEAEFAFGGGYHSTEGRVQMVGAADGKVLVRSRIGPQAAAPIVLEVFRVGPDERVDRPQEFALGIQDGWSDPPALIPSGNLDGDGAADFVVLTTAGYQAFHGVREDGSIRPVGSAGYMSHPRVADIDGDGIEEVVARRAPIDTEANEIMIVDGRDLARVLYSTSMRDQVTFGIGDLSGDRLADITGMDVASGAVRTWTNLGSGNFREGPELFKVHGDQVRHLDFNGDGRHEVLIGYENGFTIVSPAGAVSWTYNFGISPNAIVTDLDGDGVLDIATDNRFYKGVCE
jgi:hypothetical protein